MSWKFSTSCTTVKSLSVYNQVRTFEHPRYSTWSFSAPKDSCNKALTCSCCNFIITSIKRKSKTICIHFQLFNSKWWYILQACRVSRYLGNSFEVTRTKAGINLCRHVSWQFTPTEVRWIYAFSEPEWNQVNAILMTIRSNSTHSCLFLYTFCTHCLQIRQGNLLHLQTCEGKRTEIAGYLQNLYFGSACVS